MIRSTSIGAAAIRASSAGKPVRGADLDPDQRRPGLPVVAFDVLEQGDVVVGPEHLVQEPAQRTRLLREVDQEVVLEPQVHQRPLDDLAVAGHVVVAAGDQRHHRRARRPGRARRVRRRPARRPARRRCPRSGTAAASRCRSRPRRRRPSARRLPATIWYGSVADPPHRGAVDERVQCRPARPGRPRPARPSSTAPRPARRR